MTSRTGNPQTAPPENSENMGTFYSLKFRNFRFLWLGSVFTTFANWVQQTTLSWLVFDMTGSGTLLGTVNSLRNIPSLVVGPISGIAADRIDKRKLLILAELPLLIMTFILGVMFAFDVVEVWHLMVFALLTAIPNGIYQPVRRAIVSYIVPRNALPNAVALNSGAVTFPRIIGPALAGVMIATLGATGNFFIQSAAYALVMLSIYMMAMPKSEVVAKKAGEKPASIKSDLKEGINYCFKNKAVKSLMIMALFSPLFINSFSPLLAVFAKEEFNSGPQGFGYLLAGSGSGAVIGSLFVSSLNKVEKRGLIQIAGLIGFGAAAVCLTFATSLWIAFPIMMFSGAFQLFFLSTNQALIQLSVPRHLMGRVSGILTIESGVGPIAILLAGISLDVIGLKPTVSIIGISCIVLGFLVLFFMPRIRNLGPQSALAAQKEAEQAS